MTSHSDQVNSELQVVAVAAAAAHRKVRDRIASQALKKPSQDLAFRFIAQAVRLACSEPSPTTDPERPL
jgi:hypothetical protein